MKIIYNRLEKIAENLFKQKQYRAVLDTVESYESLFNYPSYRDSMRSIFNKSVQYGNLTPKSWNEAERFYPIECNLADVLFHTSKCIGKHAMLFGHILQVLPGLGFLLSLFQVIKCCHYSLVSVFFIYSLFSHPFKHETVAKKGNYIWVGSFYYLF